MKLSRVGELRMSVGRESHRVGAATLKASLQKNLEWDEMKAASEDLERSANLTGGDILYLCATCDVIGWFS